MNSVRLRTTLALAAVVGTGMATAACSSSSGSASGTASISSASSAAASDGAASFSTRVILNAKAHGWTAPDDVTSLGSNIYVGFQNGVGSKGEPSTAHNADSTLVELTPTGSILKTWSVKGKIDGLGTDTANNRVLVTVNEDANSSLYTVSAAGISRHYTYNTALPSKGGTDAITVFHGHIYTTASNPTGTSVPAVYRITLSGSAAVVDTVTFTDNSSAASATGSATTRLTLTDPDSESIVPGNAPRFANQFMVDAQGDQEAIFTDSLGATGAKLSVLKLSQSIDDTAFATSTTGMLVVTDAKADTVDVITGPFTAGAAYSVVTPGNANNAPANPAPNYLGALDLSTGTLTPLTVTGTTVVPHGAIYIP